MVERAYCKAGYIEPEHDPEANVGAQFHKSFVSGRSSVCQEARAKAARLKSTNLPRLGRFEPIELPDGRPAGLARGGGRAETATLAAGPELPYHRRMIDATNAEWETVHTVHDYYDGPRNGIADYRGVPHAYKCEWDEAADDWSAVFLLSPITPEQFAAVEEAWLIWRRYRAKFQQEMLEPGDKHPALAADWPRYTQLQATVEDALLVDAARAERAVPEFRGTIEPEHDFEVHWQSSSE